MITGDKSFSPDNLEDIKYVTSNDNIYGEKVKVILITKAASEGLDFKNIRQIHLLEPWYNMNRAEQTKGRALRNLSHCNLPFEKRNVEIYYHTSDTETDEESADMYIYRYAESKGIQIGKVTRLLKEIAVDCILNIEQTNFTVDKLLTEISNQNIKIKTSSGMEIDYQIGDKPFTHVCDYMDNCSFTCNPYLDIKNDEIIKNTYNEEYAKMNYSEIVKRVRALFKDYVFFTRDDLINLIQINRKYPIEHIDFVLSRFVDNKNHYLIDKYNRKGYMINKGEYYTFQPNEINDETISIFERSKPVNYNHTHLNIEYKTDEKPQKSAIDTVNENENINTTYNDILKKLSDEINNYNIEKDNAEQVLLLENELKQLTVNKNIALKKKEIVDYNLSTGESNWYKHLGRIYNNLINEHLLKEDQVFKYMIYHFMDTLTLEDKLTLLYNIFKTEEVNKEETIIKEYFNEKITENSIQQNAIVLGSNNDINIYIQDLNSKEWNNAERTDKDELLNKFKDIFIVKKENMNESVGFMYYIKNKGVTFKYKKMNVKGTGSVCTNSGKIELRERINRILIDNENTKKVNYSKNDIENILLNGLCVLIEVLHRHYNKENSVCFFNLEKAIINEIALIKI
jgi:hypothetical protein